MLGTEAIALVELLKGKEAFVLLDVVLIVSVCSGRRCRRHNGNPWATCGLPVAGASIRKRRAACFASKKVVHVGLVVEDSASQQEDFVSGRQDRNQEATYDALHKFVNSI